MPLSHTLDSFSLRIRQGLGASGQFGGDNGPVIDKVVDLGGFMSLTSSRRFCSPDTINNFPSVACKSVGHDLHMTFTRKSGIVVTVNVLVEEISIY